MTPRPPHILLIDDDSDIRRLTGQLLVENGMKVTSLPGGAGVARRVAGGGFDLVLLDVMLPGGDGFALCRKIRETSRIPIVMLTARAEETDRVIGLEIGADDYVVKPFSPRALVPLFRAGIHEPEGAWLIVMPHRPFAISPGLAFVGAWLAMLFLTAAFVARLGFRRPFRPGPAVRRAAARRGA